MRRVRGREREDVRLGVGADLDGSHQRRARRAGGECEPPVPTAAIGTCVPFGEKFGRGPVPGPRYSSSTLMVSGARCAAVTRESSNPVVIEPATTARMAEAPATCLMACRIPRGGEPRRCGIAPGDCDPAGRWGLPRVRARISVFAIDRGADQFLAVVDDDAVQERGEIGGLRQLVALEAGHLEDDVVGLPGAGGARRVHERRPLTVNRAGLPVGVGRVVVQVEDLRLIQAHG